MALSPCKVRKLTHILKNKEHIARQQGLQGLAPLQTPVSDPLLLLQLIEDSYKADPLYFSHHAVEDRRLKSGTLLKRDTAIAVQHAAQLHASIIIAHFTPICMFGFERMHGGRNLRPCASLRMRGLYETYLSFTMRHGAAKCLVASYSERTIVACTQSRLNALEK